MIDNIAVGKTIAKLRQNRNMTQQQLAAALNVSHQAVSKWENGAAMPDVQTLMNMTRLFGITMEQLLNGDVPEDRISPKSPLEEPLRDISNFFNNLFKPAEKKEGPVEEADNAQEDEAEAPFEPIESAETDAEGSEKADLETAEAGTGTEEEPFDLQKLLKMAPFMTKGAVDALLLEHRSVLTAGDIARFAPFISRECLETLIQNPQTEITWETLQRVAPFLKREMVDRLAKAAAQGEKLVREAAKQNCKNGDDLGKCLEDVSQKLGTEMEKAIRKAGKLGEDVANGVTSAFNDIMDGVTGRNSRAIALRKAAMERALADENWDWIAAHLKDVTDEALLKSIAQKANGLGMHDWVLDHMHGYADTRTIDAAIESGNWGWLGDHVWQFEDDLQERIALAAAKAENWQWLSTYAEQISLEGCADQVALAAYAADARVLALQLAEHCMDDAQRESLANAAAAKEDYDFLKMMAELLTRNYFGRLCVARAQAKDWNTVSMFASYADQASVEQMMELAIAEGNFDAIDLLDGYLAPNQEN